MRTAGVFQSVSSSNYARTLKARKSFSYSAAESAWGTRLDVDMIVRPDVIGDAWLPPFAKDSFDVVILDPPYHHLNAQMKNALFMQSAWIARETVVWFNTFWVSSSGGLRAEKGWLVRVGDNCFIRCLQYFSVTGKKEPVTRFKRGPAMKYNRWLASPYGFAFEDGPHLID
jgi:hypothetical protein